MKRFAVVLMVAAVIAGIVGVTVMAQEQGVKARAVMADYMNLENRVELTGQIASTSSAGVSSATGGMVKEICVSVGDRVEKGDLIAVLDDNGAADLLARIREVRQKVEAGAEEQRTSAADQIVFIAQAGSLEMGSLAMAAAMEAQSVPAAAQTGQETQQELELMAMVEGAQVKSSVNGTVTALNVKAGETALPGSPIAVVEKLDSLNIVCPINEKDLPKVKEGMTAAITSYDGQESEGKVWAVSPAAVASSTGINSMLGQSEPMCEVTVEPGEGFEGIIGLSVDVSIPYENAKGVLCVPLTALTSDGCVYRLDEEGRAALTPVELGMTSNESAQILSGLEWGDKVLHVTEEIYDGVKVDVE